VSFNPVLDHVHLCTRQPTHLDKDVRILTPCLILSMTVIISEAT